MRRILAAWLGLALLAASAQEPDKNAKAKESPVLLMSRPLGVSPGHKGKITLNGLRINDITEVISDTPGIKAKQLGKPRSFNPPKNFPKQKTGDGEVDVELELPPGFAGASVALVAKGPKGVSPPLAISVDPSPAVTEKEPNDSFQQAQPIILPAMISGAINRDRDTDVFRFEGKAGETIRVDVFAARLGSPADLYLSAHDEDRRILATSDDMPGSTDPAISLKIPRNGIYYLSLIESHDVGGPTFLYRVSVRREK